LKKKIKKLTVDGLMILLIERIVDYLPNGRALRTIRFTLTAFICRYECQPARSMDKRPSEYWSGFT